MNFKRRKSLLLLQEFSCLFPCFFPLVGLIDHVFVDGYFSIVEEGFELFVDEVDIESGVLPGNIDILDHASLITHLLFDFFIEYSLNRKSDVYTYSKKHWKNQTDV